MVVAGGDGVEGFVVVAVVAVVVVVVVVVVVAVVAVVVLVVLVVLVAVFVLVVVVVLVVVLDPSGRVVSDPRPPPHDRQSHDPDPQKRGAASAPRCQPAPSQSQ